MPKEIRRLTFTHAETIHADFEMIDNRGRKIGHMAEIKMIVSTPAATMENYGYLIDAAMPATFYEVRTHATRNGVCYGAGQGRAPYCKTIWEARELAATKAAASKTSYRRKFPQP